LVEFFGLNQIYGQKYQGLIVDVFLSKLEISFPANQSFCKFSTQNSNFAKFEMK